MTDRVADDPPAWLNANSGASNGGSTASATASEEKISSPVAQNNPTMVQAMTGPPPNITATPISNINDGTESSSSERESPKKNMQWTPPQAPSKPFPAPVKSISSSSINNSGKPSSSKALGKKASPRPDDDLEMKVAQDMALATKHYPDMSPEQIRQMVLLRHAIPPAVEARPKSSSYFKTGSKAVKSGLKEIHGSIKSSSKMVGKGSKIVGKGIQKGAIKVVKTASSATNSAESMLKAPFKSTSSSDKKHAAAAAALVPSASSSSLGLPSSPERHGARAMPNLETSSNTPDRSKHMIVGAQTSGMPTNNPVPASGHGIPRHSTPTLSATSQSITPPRSASLNNPKPPQYQLHSQLSTQQQQQQQHLNDEWDVSSSGGVGDESERMIPGFTGLGKFRGAAVRLTGVVWKRRSGLGKYSVSAAWERRRIVLQGSTLYYYKTLGDDSDVEYEEEEIVPVESTKKSWFEQAADVTYKTTSMISSTVATTTGMSTSSSHHGTGNNNARGYLDLIKEQASVGAALGHSGAPTPFALSIKVLTVTKWKLCFDTHSELMEWLAAMTDVIVQGSVDAYNSLLLQAYDPSTTSSEYIATNLASVTAAMTFSGNKVCEPPPAASSDPVIDNENSGDGGGHRLWVTGSYDIRSSNALPDVEEVEEEEKEDVESLCSFDGGARTRALDDDELYEAALAPASKAFPDGSFLYLGSILNVALIAARSSSTSVDTFWLLVCFTNLALFSFLVREDEPVTADDGAGGRIVVSRRRSTHHMRSMSMSMSSSHGVQSSTAVPALAERRMSLVTSALADQGNVKKPIAGTSSMRIENTTDPPVNEEGAVFAGWRRPPPESLYLRSHGYSVTKKKIPSPGELYMCAFCDIFESPQRYPDMASRVVLPRVQFKNDDGVKTWNAPDVFVVSVALPTDPPKLGRSSDDGGGYTVTLYLVMRQDTRDILKRVTAEGYDPSQEKPVDDIQKSKVNAVRLFEEWCRRAPTDPKFMSRFKVVPNAENLKEIGMPSWISSYNGKPFLIKRPGQTGFLYKHPEFSCMEFDISLHPFPYLAKQGICFMKDSYFKRVLVSFGFVIEGRTDDELPECLLGCLQLCYPDPNHACQGQDFFEGTNTKSFQMDGNKPPIVVAP